VQQRPGRPAAAPQEGESPGYFQVSVSGGLSRRLGAVRIFAAAGLTPARLGAVEPVGQCGAGARGTVDCCHERESQTHYREGSHRRLITSLPPGSNPTPAENRASCPGPGQARFRMPGTAFEARGFTSQPPSKRSSGAALQHGLNLGARVRRKIQFRPANFHAYTSGGAAGLLPDAARCFVSSLLGGALRRVPHTARISRRLRAGDAVCSRTRGSGIDGHAPDVGADGRRLGAADRFLGGLCVAAVEQW
jgi:hypothetical protein